MKRNTLNFVTDAVTALVMLGMIATGLLIRFVLPPGSGSHRILWGLGRHDWGDVHFWLAAGAGAVLVLHVALHWQWVCTMVLRFASMGDRRAVPAAVHRNLAGAALILLLIGVLGSFVWAASHSVRDVAGLSPRRAYEQAGAGTAFIQGYMTLSDVAGALGTSVETVRARLGLPQSIPADQTMGRLVREYGFSMQQAREKLAGADDAARPRMDQDQ